jgi:hypothetical protein
MPSPVFIAEAGIGGRTTALGLARSGSHVSSQKLIQAIGEIGEGIQFDSLAWLCGSTGLGAAV